MWGNRAPVRSISGDGVLFKLSVRSVLSPSREPRPATLTATATATSSSESLLHTIKFFYCF